MAVRRAFVIAFLATNAANVISIVAAMIIARLLTPTEIGIYSIAAAFVAVVQQLRSFGVASYIVQEVELTHDRIRSAFGLALATSWTLGVIVFAASYPFAALYGEAGVGVVMRVMAINFLLTPIGGIPMALLGREMRFGARAVLELSSALALYGTTVALAYLGFSYMSLAWGSLAGVVVGMTIANLYRPAGLPWLPRFRGLSRVISYGGPTMIADVILGMRGSTAELIVGKSLGVEAVAFLSRAQSLTAQFYGLIGQSVLKVAFPYFAQERREGRDLKPVYLSLVGYLTAIGWPFFAVLAVCAEPAIRTLFGNQWDASIQLARIACIGAAIALPFSMVETFANATGQPKITMRIEAFLLFATVVLVALAGTLGLTAVAWALCGVSLTGAWLGTFVLRRLIGIRLRDFATAFWKGMVITGVSVAAALPGAFLVPATLGEPAGLAVAGLGAGLAWLGAVFWVKHPLTGELLKVLRTLRSGRAAP